MRLDEGSVEEDGVLGLGDMGGVALLRAGKRR